GEAKSVQFPDRARRVVLHGLDLHGHEMFGSRNRYGKISQLERRSLSFEDFPPGFTSQVDKIDASHRRVAVQVIGITLRAMKGLIPERLEIGNECRLASGFCYEIQILSESTSAISVKRECTDDGKLHTFPFEVRGDRHENLFEIQCLSLKSRRRSALIVARARAHSGTTPRSSSILAASALAAAAEAADSQEPPRV